MPRLRSGERDLHPRELLVGQPCYYYTTPGGPLRRDPPLHWTAFGPVGSSVGFANVVGSAGFAPAISCSRSTRDGCYATTRSPRKDLHPDDEVRSLACCLLHHAELGAPTGICTRTTGLEDQHAIC